MSVDSRADAREYAIRRISNGPTHVVFYSYTLLAFTLGIAMSNSAITHALVYYSISRVQKIVPLASIANFSPNSEFDFVRTKKYKVCSKGTVLTKDDVLLNAFILLLGGSATDVQRKRERARLKIPSVRNISLTSDTDPTATKMKESVNLKPKARKVAKKVRNIPNPKKDALTKKALERYNTHVKALEDNIHGDDACNDSSMTILIEQQPPQSSESTNTIISGWNRGRLVTDTMSRTREGETIGRESTVLQNGEPASTASPAHQCLPTAKHNTLSENVMRNDGLTTVAPTRSGPRVSPILPVTPRSCRSRAKVTHRKILTGDSVSCPTTGHEGKPDTIRRNRNHTRGVSDAPPRRNCNLRSSPGQPAILRSKREVVGWVNSLAHRRDSSVDNASNTSGERCNDPGDDSLAPESNEEEDEDGSPLPRDQRNQRLPVRQAGAQARAFAVDVPPYRSPNRRMMYRERNTPEQRIYENLRERAQRADRVCPREDAIREMPQICICDEIYVNRDVWDVLLSKSDSVFVREIARILWGEETLAERCLDAKRANQHLPIREHRKVLSPRKYEAVKNCLYHKLTTKGVIKKDRVRRMRRIWEYMSKLIYEVRKKRDLARRMNAED